MLPFYQTLAISKHYQFTWELEEVYLVADAFYLKTAIQNLLDNAFRYTKPKGNITLTLKSNCFILTNQAEHLLKQDQLEQIFQPFYRPDFSRNRQDGGTGLGLYIVDQVLSKYNLPHQFKVQGDKMCFIIEFSN
ncbi:ATP-binding protein [Streptococcus gallolyticus]|uniref:ATP-binding protein n=1 Tax=Streptococcus gallolyticus TaxID=315405 RepID=UPI0009BE693A